MGSRSRKRRPRAAPLRGEGSAAAGDSATAPTSQSPEASAPAPPDGEAVAPLGASAAASALSAKAEPSREAATADPLRDRYARGRARDETIRMTLKPLAPGERPRSVTIAAIVAFAFAIANVVATLTVDDLSSDNGNPTTVAVVTTAILVLAGVGMLARQYWAVLGFQCILGLQIVVFALAFTRVQKWWIGLALLVAIGLLGWLFWKLVRAMARLQMPAGPGDAESTR